MVSLAFLSGDWHCACFASQENYESCIPMKRLIASLVLVALPFSAAASPDLARDWGTKASALYEDTIELLESDADIPDSYETEIGRFALTAGRLGSWIDGSGGPSDLGCIFRGMAEEGETQLMALESAETPDAREDSLKRLATMFSDAEAIAAAAALSAEKGRPAELHTGQNSCAANSAATHAILQ